MEKVLPASPSFIKLQNVTDFPWFWGGRSCSFPPYSCASLFLELCPAREKSRKKKPQVLTDPVLYFPYQNQLAVKGLEPSLRGGYKGGIHFTQCYVSKS